MAPSHESRIDVGSLRQAFGTFPTGVTVVATRDEADTPSGMTANSFTSVSLDPPLLLVNIARSASSFPAFAACDCFAVSVLHQDQQEVSSLFATKNAAKFERVAYEPAPRSGAPVLRDCASWFDCTVHQRVEAGDHLILIGSVVDFGWRTLAPLAFHRGRYAQLTASEDDGNTLWRLPALPKAQTGQRTP